MSMSAPVKSAAADLDAAIAQAKAGDIAGIGQWLAAGGAIDGYDADGWTVLLRAASRGHAELVGALLEAGADPKQGHKLSAMLPVHVAAQAGDVATVAKLIDAAPDTLDAVYDINAHTPLLQAAFYDHPDLADYLAKRGADTAMTTARGLGALELALQFQNERMAAIIRPFDKPQAEKARAYAVYLARIAPRIAPGEEGAQEKANRLVATIETGLKQAAADLATVDATLAAVRDLVEKEGADVNRLGGGLQQPPIIVAVTGNNGFPPSEAMARLRLELVRYLIARGANPLGREEHPMGAQPVIRAAVFNHLDILKLISEHCSAQDYADAINEIPLVNGLTAMHDSVLRASTAAPDRLPGYLAQIEWFVTHGGRSDLEDFSGTTQRQLAERAGDGSARDRIIAILDKGR